MEEKLENDCNNSSGNVGSLEHFERFKKRSFLTFSRDAGKLLTSGQHDKFR
jgi:hypothetical protein